MNIEALKAELQQLKKANQLLEKEKRVLENIIKSMPGYVYWKNRKGEYIGCNNNLALVSGLNANEEIIGKTDFDFSWGRQEGYEFIEEDQAIMTAHMANVREHKMPHKRPDGKNYFLRTEKIPLYQEGHLVGVLGVSVDITEQKSLEEELIESKENEARFKVLSALGGMLAHELRTPLTGIGLGISFIRENLSTLIQARKAFSKGKDQSPISQENLESLNMASSEILQLLAQADNTIDTVLASFRPSKTGYQKLETIAMDDIIQKFLSQYPLTNEEVALITVKKSPGLIGIGSSPVILHSLANLMKNALYFIKETGKGHITIGLTEVTDKILLHFHDTAKGIPKDKLNKIFELFYTTKNSAINIGIGLYYCKMAIENTGGQVFCESEEGEYTQFTLMLPKAQE